MVAQIKEIEIAKETPFITRVYDLKVAPFDAEVYEKSQETIQRMIIRLRDKMRRCKTLSDRQLKKEAMDKLKRIENDLQKALEK